jgi:Protein of unknown function (DUF2721)
MYVRLTAALRIDPSHGRNTLNPVSGLTSISRAIQLAIAPVFLMSGVVALIAVLTNRLGRVVDRARLLERNFSSLAKPEQAPVNKELATLFQRARLIYRSIILVTTCALLICSVITILFLGAFAGFDAHQVVGLLFMASMLILIVGLLSFLREVQIAIRSLHIGLPASVPPPQ